MRLPVPQYAQHPAGGWVAVGPPEQDVQTAIFQPTGSRLQYQGFTFNVPVDERWLIQRLQVTCVYNDPGGFCFDVWLQLDPADPPNGVDSLCRAVVDYGQLGDPVNVAGNKRGLSFDPEAGYYLNQNSVLRVVFNQITGNAPANYVALAARMQRLTLKEEST